MPTIDRIVRLKDGTLPSRAWPGGYPLIYRFEDGRACCPKCANDILSDPVHYPQDTDYPDDKQWHIIGCDVFFEGEAYCEGCCKTIESAYGPVGD